MSGEKTNEQSTDSHMSAFALKDLQDYASYFCFKYRTGELNLVKIGDRHQCPLCSMENEYKTINELLHHAEAIACSEISDIDYKAKHLGLAMYLTDKPSKPVQEPKSRLTSYKSGAGNFLFY